jgi:hypothetical protein
MIKRRRLTATFYQLRQAISASMNDANDFGKSIHPGQIQATAPAMLLGIKYQVQRLKKNGTDHPETNGTSFTFLGFTHVWGIVSQTAQARSAATATPTHHSNSNSNSNNCSRPGLRPVVETYGMLPLNSFYFFFE